jgi:hypothetical protein
MAWVMLVLWTFLMVGAMVMTWNQGELNRLLLVWFLGCAAILLGSSLFGGVKDG